MISPEAMQRMKAKVQDRVMSTPPGTWGRIGAGVLLGGVAIGWLVFPYLLDKVIANQITLAQGKDSRRLWAQLPTLGCNFYLFNITNPEAVMRGARPVVQEIGPYCYREVKDKTDMLEDPGTDTISYNARSTWYENQRDPSCSAPHLTGDEVLVVPNVPLLAVLLIAEKDFPPAFMSLVNQALPEIFGRLQDVFIRVSARRLLFDGVHINCSARALYPRAVCIALKQNSRALKKLGNNQYEFSFFGAKNHTPEEFRYTVKRGIEEVRDIGRLVALDGKPELAFWRGDCNKLQGTDSTVFPPFRQRENGSLAAYSSEVCRIIYGIFEGDFDYKGVKGYAYTASFGDTESNPGDRCFCPADDQCRKRGVLDALKCQGAPLVASHPHFFLGSPAYVNGVVGLSPSKEKHSILIVLEPISGTPLVVRKRLQFNIDLKPINYIPLTRNLRRTLVPLIWAEEMLDLDGNLMGLLEGTLFLPIRAVDVIKWLCIVTGVGLGVTAVVLKFRKSRLDKVHVLNREEVEGAEQQHSMSEFEPQPTLRMEDLQKHQETQDPSYIPDSKPHAEVVENGLSAVALMRTVSTMTSAHGMKLSVDERTTTPPKLNDRNMEVPCPYFVQNKGVGHDSEAGLDTSGSVKPVTIDIPASGTVEGVYPGLNSLQVKSPSSLTVKSPTKSLELQLSSRGITTNEEQPECVVEALTHEGSSNVSTAAQKLTSSLVSPQQDHVILSPLKTDSEDNIGFLQTDDNELRQHETIETPEESGSEVIFNKLKTTEICYLDLFGETVSRHSIEGYSPTEKELNNSTKSEGETYESADLILNQNVSADSEPSQPTAQEMKLVEEDINKLIAEIAQLMPKNN